MKNALLIALIAFMVSCLSPSFGQAPLIIDHTCTNLPEINADWIDSAKNKLFIAYGHTSHGSQLTSGMNALEDYFTDGRYNWSHTGGEGELHLFEGDGYGDGFMDHDCGYAGWDNETREYLDLYPECNVIIWSWCGQVNSVDLPSHYLTPMSELETEYPDVQFVYMTGHLEGEGLEGSLHLANQEIRDYCINNNKTLFDFADIEKFSPAADTNFQQYFVNDACDYSHPDGGSRNWASDWIRANPDDELTAITGHCSSCAHSQGLNCVRKGIAAWWLWARLSGWNSTDPVSISNNKIEGFAKKQLYPNPTNGMLHIRNNSQTSQILIINLLGNIELERQIDNHIDNINISHFPAGVYIAREVKIDGSISQSLIIKN